MSVWEALKWRHLALILDQSPSKWRVLPFHGFNHISLSYSISISISESSLVIQIGSFVFLCLVLSFQSVNLVHLVFPFQFCTCSLCLFGNCVSFLVFEFGSILYWVCESVFVEWHSFMSLVHYLEGIELHWCFLKFLHLYRIFYFYLQLLFVIIPHL